MPKTKKLWCEEGEHYWRRPAQRGRPPLNCPKHQPVKEEKPKPETIELWCEEGNHIWHWVKRGFEPINCPEHRQAKKKEEKQIELLCETGNHKWLWTVKRGKRPRRCPEHRTESLPVSNGHKERSGLGAIKQRRKRAAMAKLRSKVNERRRAEAQEIVNSAAIRYEEAMNEERAIFDELDALETKRLKTPKQKRRIEELRLEWDRKWRKVNNMYSSLHGTISANRRILSK